MEKVTKKRREEDEKIRVMLYYIAYNAYLYFFFNPGVANSSEINKYAYELAKNDAMKWIAKRTDREITENNEDLLLTALNVSCKTERLRYLNAPEKYKTSAGVYIKNAASLLKAREKISEKDLP